MSYRRHRLVRGRVDRKNILQQVARELDQQAESQKKQKETRKEPMFNSVREAFASRRKLWNK